MVRGRHGRTPGRSQPVTTAAAGELSASRCGERPAGQLTTEGNLQRCNYHGQYYHDDATDRCEHNFTTIPPAYATVLAEWLCPRNNQLLLF